ncbi:VWA domain-containing protein [Mycolicibacterium sp. 018/SC-01/001]|uniref:VWA domain-containing protein n=1 Tax=Mycolicibacterium sp. 018/SC-01/001 TaxID=2592069 RepID=UPI0011803F45|nr:VWA domain-containing protein [Mycolicibacterium sp. 018/SC-01/001]TRW88828.1 VWA domain-containing protein [Mycolicibacterium sp. 018/SC-01/001]
MTDSAKTLIAALLDRSGSMETSKAATEDGWRELINEQRALPGQCLMTLAQFDTEYEIVYGPTPIVDVPDLVVEPRGMTALLDAVGKFVTDVGADLASLPEDQRPGRVICLIMTDGMENASREWTLDSVRALVEQQRNQWQWKFIFLGANMDAVAVAGTMGFSGDDSITYDDSNYESTVAVMASAREMVRRTRIGEDVAFTPDDRRGAVGRTTH